MLLEEYFANGDPRFLDEVFACRAGKKLKLLADRWYRDPRLPLRNALLRYIDDGCDRSEHRPLVKGLFKSAEAAGDDEAMGHFLVAFDRLARRSLVKITHYDWRTRESTVEMKLRTDISIPAGKVRAGREGRFTLRTRRYLVRRAFRYFRRLGRKDPSRFAKASRALLLLYRDEHLSKAENLLDAWGLVHLLYRNSSLLVRPPSGVVLASSALLAALTPAPIYPEVWKGCFDEILELLENARSRTVRNFAVALLRRDYDGELRNLSTAGIRRLLRHSDEDVQNFGASLFETASGLERISISDWLDLFRLENPVALALVCDRARQLLSPGRLSVETCVELASARPAPVAEMGFAWLRDKKIASGDIDVLLRLGSADAAGVRTDAAKWLAGRLEEFANSTPEQVRELVDSRHSDVRGEAIALLRRNERFRDSLVLWGALSESPYADVRDELVRNLRDREKDLSPDSLHLVWASSLLAIHRGGRAKRMTLDRVAERVVRMPDQADRLLPLLRIALRSVRPPERTRALAAVSKAAFRAPSLRTALSRHIPELSLFAEGVA